jgi:hypothetical protein
MFSVYKVQKKRRSIPQYVKCGGGRRQGGNVVAMLGMAVQGDI